MMNQKKKINKNDIKYKLKLFTNRTWKKALIVIASIILLNTIVYFVTGKNLIERSVKALLYKAGIYTEEVKHVDINSSDWFSEEGGSWHIDKSADWIDINKAQVTLDLSTKIKTNEKNKDIIFVLDISGSMSGSKLDKVKKDAIELTNYILSDSNNKVALITFDTDSEIISDLTNDSEFLINHIENLTTIGATNYNIALKNVETILNNYQYNQYRELVVLFLTDGYPNIETPNQISQYKYLKERFPYILIEGIQYEMGEEIIEEIIEISDNQFLASTENLSNVLFEASLTPEIYEYFEITDFIDNEYFHLDGVEDIKTDTGTFSLENENGKQKVIWNLGDSFRTGKNAKMTINLVLNDKYINNNGFYPTNTKEEIKSKIPNTNEEVISSSKTPVLKKEYKITYDTNEPKDCRLKTIEDENHSAFEIVTKRNDELSCPGYLFKGWEIEENVTKINDDTFVMPSKDITIRGVWTNHSISKSMDGTIHEKATLWKRVKSDAESGLHGANILSSTINDEYKVYYYNNSTGNNVYFANSCWKIIRTTDTGGVKILYNGKPTSGTSCENTDISSTPKSSFNDNNDSLSSVGYMYNEDYATKTINISQSFFKMNYMITGSNYRYFSDSYRKENGKYYLENKDGSPVYEKNWKTDYESLTGLYTCYYTSTPSCSELTYITGTDKNYGYNLLLNDGEDIEDVNKDLKIGQGYTKNSNGVYTLTNVSNLKMSDWFNNYKNFNGQYICEDYTKTSCTNLKIITEDSVDTGIKYEDLDNNPETGILYGNSFTYDGTNYHLVDTITADLWSKFYSKLSNNHYTCLNKTGVCETLFYITDTSASRKKYFELTNGWGINDLLNAALYNEETNKTNSRAKETLEEWYENNLINFTDSIEDTVYCNNRNISNRINLNPNGGPVTGNTNLFFDDGRTPSLTCPNINDRFTVSKDNGNGKSKYPIGLLTKKEAELASTKILGTSVVHWLMTPYRYVTSTNSVSITYGYGGNIYYNSPSASQYVIPVISLKNNIGYLSGNGTPNNPYIIE